ncbi:MAG: hypothetical protein HQL27_00365 [Candidatus Omnitrophica bacterium]|nr:hypothetical protein [Candidatus Omnitrophota bacterium]
MISDIKAIEKEAQKLLDEQKFDDAAKLFSEAARSFQESGEHKQSAICFTSAASCCEFKAGRQSLYYYAASYYEKGAQEAEKSGDYEYASMLYKHAGICHERDLGYVGFSECFFLSQECYRKSLTPNLKFWVRHTPFGTKTKGPNFKTAFKRFFTWISLTFSSLLWGHGERPQRTIIFGGFLILFSAIFYNQGHLVFTNIVRKPSFMEAIYFSYITVTRIGYGDILPVGFNKVLAVFQEFTGIFLIPIFITGLCRKYLRFF